MAEQRTLGGMAVQQAWRKMRTLMEMRSKMENKGPLLSPLSSFLSSRPRSLLSTAVYMAGLFSLTGCESHETGGHQGPGPPRQHAPPQSAVHSVPQPSLFLSTLTISFTISNISSLRLSLSFYAALLFFFFAMSRLSSIRFSVCACHFPLPNTPSFFLPSSGPLILSHLYVFPTWLSYPMFLPQPHIISHKQKDERMEGENKTEKTESPGLFGGG